MNLQTTTPDNNLEFRLEGDKEVVYEKKKGDYEERTTTRESINTFEYIWSASLAQSSSLIGILLVLTICVITVIQCIQKREINVPQFLIDFVLLILGYYFGQANKNTRHSKTT